MVGVTPTLFDIITGVTTLEAFNLQVEIEKVLGGRFGLKVKRDVAVHSAGAADEKFTIIFRVEVDEGAAFKKAGFQTKRTGEACFFVNGKQAFNRTVLKGVIGQHRQLSGHANTIVGTQRGTFGL